MVHTVRVVLLKVTVPAGVEATSVWSIEVRAMLLGCMKLIT